MNAFTTSLLSLYAQATAPGAGDPADAPAGAADGAAAPAPPPPPAADTQAAKDAAAAQAAAEAGQGEAVQLGDIWNDLYFIEKIVVVILMVLLIYTIAIAIEKTFVLIQNGKKTKDFLAAFRKANSVEEAEAIVRKMPASGIKSMFDAGIAEVRKTQDLGLYTMRDARDHTMQRVSAAMVARQNDHLESLNSSLTIIASIGSNAPFIGLFGTVVGIMNSFLKIVQTQSTSLVSVAPGIAGALVATAMGLVAAIPAVILFNFASKAIGKVAGRYDDFAAEFIALVSRDMDRRGA